MVDLILVADGGHLFLEDDGLHHPHKKHDGLGGCVVFRLRYWKYQYLDFID